MIVGSWGSDFPDPSGNLRPNFASENIVAGGANASAYTQPRGRRAAAQQNSLVDKTERAKLLIQAQALIAEDSPVISVTNPGWPLAVNKRVHGAVDRRPLVLGVAVQGPLGHPVSGDRRPLPGRFGERHPV